MEKIKLGGAVQRLGGMLAALRRSRYRNDLDACIRCIFDMDDHPWHDDGTLNERYLDGSG